MKNRILIVALVVISTFVGLGAEAEGGKKDFKKKESSEARHSYVFMDFDLNGRVNITDVRGMYEWLYLGGHPAVCPAAMDFDGSGQVNVTDLMGLMQWLLVLNFALVFVSYAPELAVAAALPWPREEP